MIKFPNAKINLGLNIIEKRPDNYHNIESVFVPIPIHDILEITVNQKSSTQFSSSGIAIPDNGKPNLVEQAWQIFSVKFGIPTVDIHLHKKIPIGAGLGGGSADAAHCMLALNELFDLNIQKEELLKLSSKLGADCAFFMNGKAAFAAGIGDVFSEIQLDLSGYHFLVSYPNTHVSTPEAYKHVTPNIPKKDIREILKTPIENWKTDLKNDFEQSVFSQYPAIEALKKDMYKAGALYASMSGSGSTVFGIFDAAPELENFKDYRNWIFQL